MLLYSSKSWRIKTLNWNASQGSQQILRELGKVNTDHLACVADVRKGRGEQQMTKRENLVKVKVRKMLLSTIKCFIIIYLTESALSA